MPNLLLQKPSRNSNSKDHFAALERRLHLLKEGELTELLIEGETIQKSLSDSKRTTTIVELSKQFKNYMKTGNVNAALKLLTNNMKDGTLPLSIQTLSSLKEKHPESKDASIDILLTDISQRVHPRGNG